MAATYQTIFVDGSGNLTTVYDKDNPIKSAVALQESNATEAWWYDNEGNKYLVWQKVITEIGYYYIWDANADWDWDEEEFLGGLAYDIKYKLIVDGFDQNAIIKSGMIEVEKGTVINEDKLDYIQGFLFVLADADADAPTIVDRLGNLIEIAPSGDPIKDVNGKEHILYMFPKELNGPCVGSAYKTLKIN